MKAVFAILKDSFREAAASRVLLIALIAIVVVLLALAPLSFTSAPSTQLRPFELVDTQLFLQTLADGPKSPGTPAAHLWSLLKDDQRKQIDGYLNPPAVQQPTGGPGGPRPVRVQARVLELVNKLLPLPEFYHPESWASVELDETLRAADAADIDAEMRASRNLKRLAAAFTQSLVVEDEMSLSLSYGTMVLFGPLQGAPSQSSQLIDQTIIVILSIFLGFFGIFSSLLVTASIIPRTFEPGEISLLLSKPVRRTVLFVTKFIGGCAFTTLCAGVLVTGIWLLLWTRFGLWRPELLLCIPLYVFLFAVYFSVSALAGAVWRNATVSLIIVVVFWVVVTTTGGIHAFMTNGYLQTQQLVEVTSAGSEVFVVDGAKKFRRWDPEKSDWVRICDDGRGNNLMQLLQSLRFAGVRPRIVASATGDRILALQSEMSRFGGASAATLISADKENGYLREVESVTPEPVFAVFMNKNGDVILPGIRSVYQFKGVSDQVRKTQAFLKQLSIPWPMARPSQAFQALTETPMKPQRADAAVAFNISNDQLVYWDNGTLTTLNRREDGVYVAGATRDFDKKQAAVIAAGGGFVLCAMADGVVQLLDAKTLETLEQTLLKTGDVPKSAEFSSDGNWGVVMTHGGNLLSLDGKTRKFLDWTPRENGTVSAIRFDEQGKLLLANGRRSIFVYASAASDSEKSFLGLTEWPHQAYDYVVRPLYLLLPKPSEVDNIVQYLVTGKKSVEISGGPEGRSGAGSDDLNQQRVTFDLNVSLWSNLAFIAVMLGLGCVYIARRDF
jgi:ABC-type transport system involved in multi-copper enzyme maturation permease subunit